MFILELDLSLSFMRCEMAEAHTGVNCFQQHTHKKSLALSVQMWAIIVIYLMPVKIKPHEGRPC